MNRYNNHFEKKIIKKSNEAPLEVIVSNIKNYSSHLGNCNQPVNFQIGISGEGSNPNYQVEFEDGTIQTFRFSGKLHSIAIFKPANLSDKYQWENY